ncbi:MAG: ATP-binding protein [Nitrospirota bacterium]
MNHYNRKSESAAGGPEEAPAFFQWTRRLSTRLALLTALVLAGVIAVLTLLAAEEFSSDAAGERELQAKALAQNIAAVTADGLLAEDYASVEEVLVRSAAFPGVIGIWVSDRRGRVLAHVVRRGDEPPEVRLDPEDLALPSAALPATEIKGGRLQAWHPIVAGTLVGWARVEYSLEKIAAIRRHIWMESLAAGVLAILASAALLVVFTRRPARAIRRAADFAETLDARHGEQIPVERGSVEIEMLTRALNLASGRLAAQEAAEAARARLTAILEATTDFVATADAEGLVLYYNAAARRMLGIGGDEDIRAIRIPDTHPAWANKVVLGEGLPTAIRDGVWSGETALLSRDGREIPVSQVIIAHKAPDGSVEFLSTIARDITERKNLETQFRHAQKMEAVGRLAGGVAHDFNNMLTVINGYAEMLLGRMKPDDPSRPEIAAIREAGERAASLTQQLLAFSRRQVVAPQVLSLNAVVSRTDKMLKRLIGEDVELVTILAPVLGTVRVDPGQMEQVIMNLAVNARDAMPNGGKLTIETADVDIDESYAREHVVAVPPGPYVLLAVSDTGCGMDAETLQRVFEPFFTTKGQGKGTGLGLSTVYGIVKQNAGYIWVYSEPGRGTTFKIYFPRAVEEAGALAGRKEPALEKGGNETVLLVEDDPAVRAFSAKSLRQHGYTVLEAADGEGALAVCDEHEGPIHLMVTDVVMPGMSGRELAEHLARVCPNVRVLYVSGYTDNAIVHHGVLDAGVAFLQKPFSAGGLLRKVMETLGS